MTTKYSYSAPLFSPIIFEKLFFFSRLVLKQKKTQNIFKTSQHHSKGINFNRLAFLRSGEEKTNNNYSRHLNRASSRINYTFFYFSRNAIFKHADRLSRRQHRQVECGENSKFTIGGTWGALFMEIITRNVRYRLNYLNIFFTSTR